MLAIEVVFLTGRYVATAYNTRSTGEWPPHPARLFSALVATHCAADKNLTPGLAEERAVLEWLEQLGAPTIRASEAAERDVVTVYVPTNDAALTDVDAEAKAVTEAEAALTAAEQSQDQKAVKAAQRALVKAKATYGKSVTRALEAPEKGGDPEAGKKVLPEYRGRQPRTFPSVTPEEPRVEFVWPEAMPTADQILVLNRLLARVVRLGHSSSLVSMRTLLDPGSPTWVPSSAGSLSLRTFEVGQVVALERAFEIHQEIEPRIMPARQQAYSRLGPVRLDPAAPSLFGDDWLVLRRVGGIHLPMTSAAGIARQLRRALMKFADPIPEMLSGHTFDRSPSERPHLAVVPLPFVGHANASGLILGIALILPRAADASDRKEVFRAVAAWEALARAEDEDVPIVRLHLGNAGDLLLQRVDLDSVASTLTPSTWCRPAHVWSSVTPVALDHNPGDLRARDPHTLSEAVAAAQDTIVKACERIGLPTPASVEILPAAPWAHAAKARHYPRFPASPDRVQRVLTHVRLEFDGPVAGPIILGAGRYQGLGLFRPAGPA